MPRSNKKKHPQKPPPKNPSCLQNLKKEDHGSGTTISYLLVEETSRMLARAISSARQHGINLEPGSSNPGNGDCAFEAIIQNNNDRACFKEKFNMSIDYYRRLWVTDMANRTLYSDYNIYTPKQWIEGWQEMLIPGTYERGIYGDLMIPGIACGVRKIILIFNTNENSPHDPIFIVDPTRFNVEPDSSVPIVLAYNMVHYESLHPCTESDIQATIKLVRDYLEGRYQFCKEDFPALLMLESDPKKVINTADEKSKIPLPYKRNKNIQKDESIERSSNSELAKKQKIGKNLNVDEIYGTDMDKTDFMDTSYKLTNIKKKTASKMIESVPKPQQNPNQLENVKLCYRLKHKNTEYSFNEAGGKIKCPFCEQFAKNISLHFNKSPECKDKIDDNHFEKIFTELSKKRTQERKRVHMQNKRTATKNKGAESYSEMKEKNRKEVQDYREKRKNESHESKLGLLERDKHDKRNYRARRKAESQESYLKLLERDKQDKRNSRARRKTESQESYLKLLEQNKQDVHNFRTRKRNESLESYLALLEKNKHYVQESRNKTQKAVDEVTRRKNFSKSVIFGPIFTCSCCCRMLYENGVNKITPKFKESMERKQPTFYNSCIVRR